MVAITAGCSVVEPWAAIICGVVAAPCVIYGELVMQSFKVRLLRLAVGKALRCGRKNSHKTALMIPWSAKGNKAVSSTNAAVQHKQSNKCGTRLNLMRRTNAYSVGAHAPCAECSLCTL